MATRKFRTEQKYYLHVHDYVSLRHKISSLLPLDSHSVDGEGYRITSLYFDSPISHSLNDKNNGVFHREKYRIRIYNGSDNIIAVERKSKVGDYVCKESALISREQYDEILQGNYEALIPHESYLIQDFQAMLAYRAFRPAAIVDYVREAYVYEHGNVRITFDKELSAGINSYDLFDAHLALEEAVVAPRTIMEVKFDDYLPEHIRMMVQPEKHNRSSISKYVICREMNIKHFKLGEG